MRAAASSMARGTPSSWVQICSMTPRFAAVTSNPARTEAARSANRVAPAESGSGPNGTSRSAARWSGARLVIRMRTRGHADARRATKAPESRTRSIVSMTSSNARLRRSR